MGEELRQSRQDILRQHELLDVIHLDHWRRLQCAGTIGRLFRVRPGHLLSDPRSFIHAYRDFTLDNNGEIVDVAALEIGAQDQNQRHVIQLGLMDTNNNAFPNEGFEAPDVTLVESMLEGLREDYNYGILPNLSNHYNCIEDVF